MRHQVKWLSFGNEANPFERYYPLRPIIRWWNDRKMRQCISHQLDLRFQSSVPNSEAARLDGGKTVVDLALDTYRNGVV